jgi:hypothetical protein
MIKLMNQSKKCFLILSVCHFQKHSALFIKKKYNPDTRSKTISIDGIVSVLKSKNIVIKIGSRCCPHHLNQKRCIKAEYLDELEASIETVNLKKS